MFQFLKGTIRPVSSRVFFSAEKGFNSSKVRYDCFEGKDSHSPFDCFNSSKVRYDYSSEFNLAVSLFVSIPQRYDTTGESDRLRVCHRTRFNSSKVRYDEGTGDFFEHLSSLFQFLKGTIRLWRPTQN